MDPGNNQNAPLLFSSLELLRSPPTGKSSETQSLDIVEANQHALKLFDMDFERITSMAKERGDSRSSTRRQYDAPDSSQFSYEGLFTVHANMLDSVQADNKIHKWLEKGNISWGSFIMKLKDLQTDVASLIQLVEQFVELSKKPDENQETLAEKEKECVRLRDNYGEKKKDILSMLLAERGQKPELILRIHTLIGQINVDSPLDKLEQGVTLLQSAHDDLKDIVKNYKAGAVAFYTLLLDNAIHGVSEDVETYFNKISPRFKDMLWLQPADCTDDPYEITFFKANLIAKLKEPNQGLSLTICDIEYAKFIVDNETNIGEWHFVMTNEDNEKQDAWAKLYGEYKSRQSQQAQSTAA
ncbi:hypothetical protein IWQ61_004235 [Dispira simplex]|nr:hypothetical protein IWQ61_004235 [Dispira simplex]